jgi:hypothetical protein
VIFSVVLQSLTHLGRLTYRRFLELFRHMVGLLGRVVSPSQGLYLHRITQHRKTRTNIHALSGIRTHDPSNQPAKIHASGRTTTVTGSSDLRDANWTCIDSTTIRDSLWQLLNWFSALWIKLWHPSLCRTTFDYGQDTSPRPTLSPTRI